MQHLWIQWWPLSPSTRYSHGYMAPLYANIFMGYLKEQLLMLVSLKSHMWLRFFDDIDIQWRHGCKDLHELLHKANTFHKTIEFTSEISNDNYVFLDTKYHIEGSQLVKDLYSKPTDSHQYLLQTSCHPRHCCKNIPYSLALRIRICSQEADYERRTHELFTHLCRCGYKSDNVDKAITKASSIQRHELPKYKSNTIHNTFCSNVPH